MGGRRRRRRRRRAKVEKPPADSPPKTSSSGSSGLSEERVAPRKIPSSSSKPYEEEEVVSALERKRPDPSTLSLILLNLIRTFYLEALARLPASRLWSKHARGVFVAAYLDRLSTMLVPSPIPEDLCPPPPLITTWVAAIIKSRIENCKDAKEFSRRLTEAALCKYAQQTGQHYELHFICGLHMFIRSEAYWHINFLARPKDAARELPICFFAEATVPMGEDDEFLEEDIVLCCPVNPSTVGRCRACTAHCIRINHPTDKEHHGGLQDKDDAEVWNGDDHWVYEFPQLVDFITFDADRDCATVLDVEKRFPRRSDGDESVENIWIAEM